MDSAVIASAALCLSIACLAVGYRAGRAVTRRAALRDVLTGLPNRALFADRAERALVSARREGTHAVVILLDLDRFKEVNDGLGHPYGDELLRQVGPRIAAVLRSSDTVARLGGDEFGVLLPAAASAQAGAEVADKILAALREPFRVHGIELEIDASLGVAAFPDHGLDVETLVQHADVAMYAAKGARTGQELYSRRRGDARHEPLALLGDLEQAMDDGRLSVVYQPKVHLVTGAVEGVEALVRWNHPQRGVVLPSRFVGHAEHTGLMRPLTLHVLGETLAQLAAWRRDGLLVRAGVNVSARTLLDPALPDELARLLERFELPARALELEVTEVALMADPARAADVLDGLRALDVGLAIDDFGTGWSSLGTLRELPVRELKIDRSFVAGLAADRGGATVVRSTIDLARHHGLRVVAEGVEDEHVRRRLAVLGCDLGQGYLFCPPLDGDALSAWAAERELAATEAG